MASFYSPRPRSITGLLLASFALVAMPLVIAVSFAVSYVDRLGNQSERLILQGVAVTRASKRLTNSITDMERNARQYAVLENPQLATRFAENHALFLRTLDDLNALSLNTVSNWNLGELRRTSQSIAEAVAAEPFERARLEAELAAFESLRQRANAITDQGNVFIDNEIAGLQATTRQARRFLFICISALLPAVLLLVLLFTALISRPIRQIQTSIRRLGEGDYDQPVVVSAPSAELDAIGSRLDWMRHRLAAAESEKNQFLRQMSHELKTPLASIREGAGLMADGTLGEFSASQSEVVDILQENSIELQFLIENLLNFAAWQQHRSQLRYTHFDLTALASDIVARHRLTISRKQLVVKQQGEPVKISADHDQIRILLDNLVSNAIKYSPYQGRLFIVIRIRKSNVRLLVADDGPGIPEKEREHVFNPFYQSSQPAHAHVQGSGIGLSVVREVVRAHGGLIEVIDNKISSGACLRVSLPRTVKDV